MIVKKTLALFPALLIAGCMSAPQSGNAPVPPPDRVVQFVEAGEYPNPEAGPVSPAAPIVMRELPRVFEDESAIGWLPPARSGRPESPISPEEQDRRRALALLLPPQPGIQIISTSTAAKGSRAPTMTTSFEALNFDDGYAQTPPDQEMAAGPNHLIAIVNSMVEIYDTAGNSLSGPVATDTFFSGVSGCSDTFDPNTLYDEKEDRFFVGIDSRSGPGTDNGYCFAVTATGDPTGTWYRYSFDATANIDDFFDFPHAGIGDEAIFMGANVYNAASHADVWAIRKSDAYNNLPVSIVRQQATAWTPQPMNVHGFAQGTWPNSNTHYVLTDYNNGSTVVVQAWTDPFGANTFVNLGTVNLNAASGVTGGYPIDTPQLGSGDDITANDYRVLDAEYRNGRIWLAQTISCNPGLGTVNCIRWAELDPVGNQGSPSVIQSGVFATDGEYRTFPDLAVNHCNDMTIGYTKSHDAMYPSVFFTGRLGDDPAGTVNAEAELKAGEIPHSSYEAAPYRWGDYSGATPDPNGIDTWYLGQYTRNNSGISKWGTYVGRFTTDCAVSALLFADGFENGESCAWSSTTGGVPCP